MSEPTGTNLTADPRWCPRHGLAKEWRESPLSLPSQGVFRWLECPRCTPMGAVANTEYASASSSAAEEGETVLQTLRAQLDEANGTIRRALRALKNECGYFAVENAEAVLSRYLEADGTPVGERICSCGIRIDPPTTDDPGF